MQVVRIQQRLEVERQIIQRRVVVQLHTLGGEFAGRIGVVVRQGKNLPARQGRHLGIGGPCGNCLAGRIHRKIAAAGIQLESLDVAAVVGRLIFRRVLVLVFQCLEFAAVA
ncbi:hypothetical protein D3C85_1165850 [compost metagenome]